jgi:hypothetical protein
VVLVEKEETCWYSARIDRYGNIGELGRNEISLGFSHLISPQSWLPSLLLCKTFTSAMDCFLLSSIYDLQKCL